MEAIGALGILLGLFLTALVVLLVVGAVKATKAVVTKVEKTEAQARRAVENVTLKAKTYAKPGPVGELAAVRLSLRTALGSTRDVLAGGVATDGQLAESLRLLDRLDAHAAELDAELRLLEREPDPVRITAKLPELRERAERITHSAESMRWAAQDRMHRFAADDLSRLSEECESEAGALRHWDRGGAGASGGSGAGGSGAGGSAAGASGGSAAGESASGASGGSAAGGAAAGAPGEPSPSVAERLALAARNGRLSAEEVLGLGEPIARLGQRLRKPNTGSSAN
ncbi:hypothetical protein [Kitasatospora sp. LaBMicrA B282]|uniref:hypothetical protein n=1 Tax=Kitasatospora sp. LaBMicrA B282 TaxID=3420949 RepID=UPI003D096E1A